MKKPPVVADYGGHSYGGKPQLTRVTKSNTRSFRCLDCGALRHLTRSELNRASRPRCLDCGGPLEESKSSVERVVGTKRQRSANDRAMQERHRHLRALVPCWSCGERFEDGGGLAAHLMSKGASACVYEYKADGLDKFLYRGTIHVRDRETIYKRWSIRGLSGATKQIVEIGRTPVLGVAKAIIKLIEAKLSLGLAIHWHEIQGAHPLNVDGMIAELK